MEVENGIAEKRAANQRNSKFSFPSGPKNTSGTRLNALKHGILSNECFIEDGDGRENREEFEEFCNALRESLNPVGAVEEFFGEKFISGGWRSRRVPKYEVSSIKSEPVKAVEDWEQRQASKSSSRESTKFLESELERRAADHHAVTKDDPITARPEIWRLIFQVAVLIDKVPVSDIRDLEVPSGERDSYSKSEVEEVIDSACKIGKTSKRDFWHEVEQHAFFEFARAIRKLELRNQERTRESAILPTEKAINIILRYEGSISLEMYKGLHELQRLQAARLGLRLSVPLAIDVDVEPSTVRRSG